MSDTHDPGFDGLYALQAKALTEIDTVPASDRLDAILWRAAEHAAPGVAQTYRSAAAEIERLAAEVERLRAALALHFEFIEDDGLGNGQGFCNECGFCWPCRTVRAAAISDNEDNK